MSTRARDASSRDALIRRAIEGRRLIGFHYRGAARVTEPHDYGILTGRTRLLVFQLRGKSRGRLPGWRVIEVPEIENLVVLDETFPGSRGQAGQAHKTWDEVFCRVR